MKRLLILIILLAVPHHLLAQDNTDLTDEAYQATATRLVVDATGTARTLGTLPVSATPTLDRTITLTPTELLDIPSTDTLETSETVAEQIDDVPLIFMIIGAVIVMVVGLGTVYLVIASLSQNDTQ